MLKKEDVKDVDFLEKLDAISEKTGKSRLDLIYEANGYRIIKNGKDTDYVALGDTLLMANEIDTTAWGIPGLCGMHSVVRVFGDTEASEQALIQLCADLVFGRTTFCSDYPVMNRNGLLIVSNGTSLKIQRAIREKARKLGVDGEHLLCSDENGQRIVSRKLKDEDGFIVDVIDHVDISSFTDARPEGAGKTLWLERSWTSSADSAFRSGEQMLAGAVDDLVMTVRERHLGFIAFETPRPHFNRLEDAGAFFTSCRRLASRAGIDVIVRFIWDEHNRNIAEKVLYGTDEEQTGFSKGMRSYISAMERQTYEPPMVEAHHDAETGKIAIDVSGPMDEERTTTIGYLDQKIQRTGKDDDLSSSTEFDV